MKVEQEHSLATRNSIVEGKLKFLGHIIGYDSSEIVFNINSDNINNKINDTVLILTNDDIKEIFKHLTLSQEFNVKI